MSAAAQPVRITVDGPDAEIAVAGNDVSQHVRSYQLHQRKGEVAQLILEGQRLDVVFDGLAEVNIVAPHVEMGEATAAFLEQMDAETIQALALEAHGWVGDSTTACALKVLIDLARGGDGKIGRPRAQAD